MRPQSVRSPLQLQRATWPTLLLLAMMLPSAPALSAPAPKTPPPQQVVGERPDPDAMLIAVMQDLAANRLREALQKADTLVAAYPNFQLGHLIRGDLLLMHARPVNSLGAGAGAPADKLENLRREAAVRIKALRERPDPKLVPDVLLQMRPDQKVAFVVDARRSRLFVYENRDGAPHFVRDYYISQGKLGVNKLREGDQKTPLGVYYVTSRLQREKLPDFYGTGALPISYPNEWDKLNGRSGSGIWLHGTPSDSYSRPPLSSDGCVVLTNPDLLQVAQAAEIGKTPVVIADELRFVSRERLEQQRAMARGLTERWRSDAESRDTVLLRRHYSRHFRADHGTLEQWLDRQQKWFPALRNARLALRDGSYFRYPGAGEMVVATFSQDATVNGKTVATRRLRQYWAREGENWRIVAENVMP